MTKRLCLIAMVPVFLLAGYVWAADFGTPAEAKAMLEKAIAEIKKDKGKALEMFTKGQGGFKDRDLYPYCGGPDDQLVTAIEVYKAEFGYYPPDDRGAYPRGPINSVTNALYYELTGTVVDNAKGEFYTPDRGEVISAAAVRQFFGVDGFVNASPDPKKVRKFIELKSDQYGEISSTPDVEVLIVPVRWPEKIDAAQHPVPQRKGLNPWHYVSTNPTNNPGRFDLWAEFIDGNRVKLIGNWSRDILDRP